MVDSTSWRGAARTLASPLIEVRRRQRRRRVARSYYDAHVSLIGDWARRHTEDDNFYYGLTESNRADLAHLIALFCAVPAAEVEGLLEEIETDRQLIDHVHAALSRSPGTRDAQVAFGRRIGWYAFVRLLKPRVVVETGVHHGVGACVLARALMRNEQEGYPGRYYGTDIDPQAGVLFTRPYSDVGEILYGDSIASLRDNDLQIDVFINDSDHSREYEAQEYAVVEEMLTESSLILGDNSHVTDALRAFADARDRPYAFFAEEPDGHWYPGAGIGISPSSVPLVLPARAAGGG